MFYTTLSIGGRIRSWFGGAHFCATLEAMLYRGQSQRLDRKLELAFQELPVEPVAVRMGRLAATCITFGQPVHLEHGFDIPDPEVSLRLLEKAADRIEAIDWLSTKLTIDEKLGCWALPLTVEHDAAGRARYPTVTNGSLDATHELAHRFVVRRMFGQIETNEHLDHKCRSHACCNPTHLEIVTHTNNVRRGAAARRAVSGQRPLY